MNAELSEVVDEVLANFRTSQHEETVKNVKKMQDELRYQYEKRRYDAKELLKAKIRQLKRLEIEINDSHNIQFESEKSRLEDEQEQLKASIEELKQSIKQHKEAKKNKLDQIRDLSNRQLDLSNKIASADHTMEAASAIYQAISSITWDLDHCRDKPDDSGIIWSKNETIPITLPKSTDSCTRTALCNDLWDKLDCHLGTEWEN